MGAKKKTYLDDVYSTYLYVGDATNNRNINNGIDLAGEGGLVLLRARNNSLNYVAFDTERGASKRLDLGQAWAEGSTDTSRLNQFNSNGFRVSGHINTNYSSSYKYVSNTFRKAPGFFDVVKYTGNGSNRTISHSLGSIPGMIIIKNIDTARGWAVYHRGYADSPENFFYMLNSTGAASSNSGYWNNTAPTATNFSLGDDPDVNSNGDEYVAYVFAGGESTAATARSIEFNGSSSILYTDTDDDYEFGTGDFTIECWIRPHTVGDTMTIYDGLDGTTSNRIAIWANDDKKLRVYANNTSRDSVSLLARDRWYHVAFTRTGTTSRLFLNGKLELSWTDSINYAKPSSKARFGSNGSGQWFNGEISNFRIVKGTAVYTTTFIPPVEPLTNITNTKLLFCNNSSTTGSTVTPQSITELNADPSTLSPFDDPSAFVYGDSGKETIIKTGGYKGDGNNGSSQGTPNSQEVYLGWEPQFVLIKRANNAEAWVLYDSMRGLDDHNSSSTDAKIEINTSGTESNTNHVDITSTGFTFATSNGQVNANGNSYIYLAIRRPDGYVGKPPDAGTDVFTAATRSSTSAPRYISNFPVDFALLRNITSSSDWFGTTRLNGGQIVKTNTKEIGVENSDYANFDHSNGYSNQGGVDHQAWMWKRHAGFDVVTYKGTQTVQEIKHSMNKAPEMIWTKNRDNSGYNWSVYHSGLGDNRFKLYLNTAQDYSNDQAAWNNTAPTSTHFTLGTDATANHNGSKYTAMLFASISGISKVGVYTGNGSGGTNDISLGFAPRFIIIKNSTSSNNNWTTGWFVFDTVRGWASGNADKRMRLNDNAAQSTENWIDPTSTGFSLNTSDSNNHLNNNGHKFIYYAHA